MKRYQFCGLAVRKICLMLPGLLCSATLLSAMIVSMTALSAAGREQPVLNFYTTEDQVRAVSFPLVIEGTTLTAERTAVYDGPYLEDRSNTEVTGIVALVLRNHGLQTVERAEVTLIQGDRRLVFCAETIPPGAAVLVLEANKSPYQTETYCECYGYTVIAQEGQLQFSDVQITECGMRGITVQNMTDMPIVGLQLHHKGWLEEPGIYIGGVTYKTFVGSLAPGESVQVYPAFYAAGYSKILQITAE